MTDQQPSSQEFKYNIGQISRTQQTKGTGKEKKSYRAYELKVLGRIVLVFKTKSIGYGWKALGRSTWKNHTLKQIIRKTMDDTETSELCKDAENNLKWKYIKKTALTVRQLNAKTLIYHYNTLHKTHRKKWKTKA